MGYGILFHLGCLCTLTFSGVDGGAFMYGGFMFKFAVVLFLDWLCLFLYFDGQVLTWWLTTCLFNIK